MKIFNIFITISVRAEGLRLNSMDCWPLDLRTNYYTHQRLMPSSILHVQVLTE